MRITSPHQKPDINTPVLAPNMPGNSDASSISLLISRPLEDRCFCGFEIDVELGHFFGAFARNSSLGRSCVAKNLSQFPNRPHHLWLLPFCVP
jgi:hypothetical protein